MIRCHLSLKLVLIATYLLYFRLPLFIDTDSHSQLLEMISSLNEFIKKYKWKGLGLAPQTIQSLNMRSDGWMLFGDEHMQNIVNDAILGLLPALFNYGIIDIFELDDISNCSLFGLEEIGKDSVYD
jgi:hypothetical protein